MGHERSSPPKGFQTNNSNRIATVNCFLLKIFRSGQNAEETCEHSAQEPTAPQPL
jgi:hypothetical protein